MSHKKQEVVCNGTSSIIKTAKNNEIIVDTEDLEKLMRYSWCLSKTGYPVANIKGKVVRIHRYLLDVEPDEIIDHKNGNPLDNRKANLRICTPMQNARNCKLSKNNTSGYVGVSKTPAGKYRARIVVNRQEINLGHYESMESAIVARLSAERDYYGDFAPVDNALNNNAYKKYLKKGRAYGMLYCGKKDLIVTIEYSQYKPIEYKSTMKSKIVESRKQIEKFKKCVAEIGKIQNEHDKWVMPAGDMPVSVEIKFFGTAPKTSQRWFKEAARADMFSPSLPSNWVNISEAVIEALDNICYSSKSQIFDLKVASAYSDTPRIEVYITGYYLNFGEIRAAANARIKARKEQEKNA